MISQGFRDDFNIRPRRNGCCTRVIDIIITVLAVFIAFAIGLLIGTLTEVVALIGIGAIILFITLLFILLIIAIIFRRFRQYRY